MQADLAVSGRIFEVTSFMWLTQALITAPIRARGRNLVIGLLRLIWQNSQRRRARSSEEIVTFIT
jgi:hypothetical protein